MNHRALTHRSLIHRFCQSTFLDALTWLNILGFYFKKTTWEHPETSNGRCHVDKALATVFSGIQGFYGFWYVCLCYHSIDNRFWDHVTARCLVVLVLFLIVSWPEPMNSSCDVSLYAVEGLLDKCHRSCLSGCYFFDDFVDCRFSHLLSFVGQPGKEPYHNSAYGDFITWKNSVW